MKENKTDKVIEIGTLYELNQQAMQKEKGMTDEELEKIRPNLEAWFNWQLDGYAMLLSNDRHDYTVFHLYQKQNPYPPRVAVDELFITLKNRGIIQSIEQTLEDDCKSWEIWLKIYDGEKYQSYVYYLFNYDFGVIEC